jgi:hypothetical protein
VIEAYIDELDQSLRGPRRVKADLLAEARDALVDTAQASTCGCELAWLMIRWVRRSR